MRPTQKGKAALISAVMREAAMNPLFFDTAVVVVLISWVLLLMAFVQSPL
jgi:hypothetical protein